jgi:hypothetical protein
VFGVRTHCPTAFLGAQGTFLLLIASDALVKGNRHCYKGWQWMFSTSGVEGRDVTVDMGL